MAGANKGNAAGFAYFQIYTKNTTGEAIGQVAQSTGLAQNTTSSALLIGGGTSTDFSAREPTVVEFRDADAIAGKMGFGGGDIQPFNIDVEEINATAAALFTQSNVDTTTNTSWSITGANSKQTNLEDVGVILSQRFQSRDSATAGTNQYVHHILPACDVRVLPGGLSYQATSSWQFNITPSFASKFPWGEAFGATQAWTDNETDYFWLTADNPISLTAFTGDGAQATFIAGYRPTSAVVTVNATPNFYAENGTAEALTSISVTTGVATPDAAPDADKRCVLVYETIFTAI